MQALISTERALGDLTPPMATITGDIDDRARFIPTRVGNTLLPSR